MFKLIRLSPAILVLSFGIAGCGSRSISTSSEPYIRADIAECYANFYSKGVINAAAGAAAVTKAKSLDPKNGYTDYLAASLAAQNKDFETAKSELKKGNAADHVMLYMATPAPDGSSDTLNRIRQLGFSVSPSKDAGKTDLSYAFEMGRMGKRIADSTPLTSLAVMTGASVMRRALQANLEYFRATKDATRLKTADSQLKEFLKWNESLSRDLAETVKDMNKEAGKVAGLTEEELVDYAAGKPLKDQSKQTKADAERVRIYEEEIAALKRLVLAMPDMPKL